MKIRCPNTILVVCYILLTLSAQISWALSLRLSKKVGEGRQQKMAVNGKEPSRNWLDTVRGNPDSGFQKRVCNGFPCMYSHLGTKAGRASLYRTLASFIDDCLNDASCDPGRRKRSRIQAVNIRAAQGHVIRSGLQRRFKNTKISRTVGEGMKSNGT